ncbi:MAG: hypothetical protein IJY95_04025 [Bacteroides sp.]|nr:hypothetical protein [Bacteroides sp.]
MIIAIVQPNGKPGDIVLTARGKRLKTGKIVIKAEKPFLVSGLRQNTFQVSNCLIY